MLVIGLTGGCCSGKSYIASHLMKAFQPNCVWIDCDKLTYDIYTPGSAIMKKLVDCFGDCILDSTGTLDRRSLGQIVFGNMSKLQQLNVLVWPEMEIRLRKELHQIKEKNEDAVVLVDAAVLTQAGWDRLCDKVLVVKVPIEVARARAIERGMMPGLFDQISSTQQKYPLEGDQVIKCWEEAWEAITGWLN